MALLAETAANDGRRLQLEDVPGEVAESSVWIAWEFVPKLSDLERDGCSPVDGGSAHSVGLRQMRDRTEPPEMQPNVVLVDPEAIRRLVSHVGVPTRSIAFLAVFAREALRPDSMLFWRTRSRCEAGRSPRVGETAALITAEDLLTWR